MIYAVSRVICAFLFKILFRIKVYGKEHIPRKGGFILASNHVSFLDPPALGVACPRKLNYMARDDLFYNPLFSRWLSAVGVVPLKRKQADISALKIAMKRLRCGQGLLLFPEGTRQQIKGPFSKPEPGIGFLALKVGVPVIPAFIKGTEKALPKGAKFILPKKVSVRFGKQIHVEGRMPYQDIANLVMHEIRHLSC